MEDAVLKKFKNEKNKPKLEKYKLDLWVANPTKNMIYIRMYRTLLSILSFAMISMEFRSSQIFSII